MKILKAFGAASVACFFAVSALAQTAPVTNHAFAIGKGPGFAGYTSLLCASTQIAIGQTAANPACFALSGDVTMNASGVTAIGAGKVLGSMLGTMSSAELRAALSDEVGTGAAYFVGGALGTPASGTLTNATGLPFAGLASNTLGSLTHKASPTSSDLLVLQDQAAGGANKYCTLSECIGALASGVSSIAGNTGAFTLGYGLTNSTNDLRASLTSASNSLAADAALSSTASYTTGPTVAQGTSGTWFASGGVTILNANADTYTAKLWDGTTIIASGNVTLGTNARGRIFLSGVISSPAGNIRISVIPISTTTGNIKANDTGNSKDSTLSVIRIAP